MNCYKTFCKLTLAALLLTPVSLKAFELTSASAGAETLSATWGHIEGAAAYKVTYSSASLDEVVADPQLIRQYPEGIRVDIPGVAPADYMLKVEALDSEGNSINEATAASLDVYPAIREGFAFTGGNMPGAYNPDGTLKEGSDVLYITKNTVNTVSLDVVKDKKGNTQKQTGLANILSAIGKGYHKTPLAIRIIGTVADTDFDGLKDGNYLNLQGNNASDRRLENVTIEGIGTDATLYGYGICFKRTRNIEVKNVGIMLFGDDAISMDTDNSNIWLHNIDFFYGRPGRDADQVKGDGSIDMKYRSTDITINHNHFFDSGKVMGCGGTTGESENLRITFHHNWFDHADSRCPRLHYTTAHVYNNYYDGVPTYCVGNTTESSAFVEANYFRNCKRPIMISGQGTDTYDAAKGTYTLKGTFSGQDGGMTKAFNNVFAGEITPKLVYHTQHETQFDAYLATSRDEQLPSSIVSFKGNWAYNNFDTAEDMYPSSPDAPESLPELITSQAGRLDQGDFKWHFENAVDDENHDVNQSLKDAINAYQSRLIAVQGEPDFGLSSIGQISVPDSDSMIEVYDLAGRKLSSMPASSGIYIIRQGERIFKVAK